MVNKLLILFLTINVIHAVLTESTNYDTLDRDENGFFIIRPSKESSGIYRKAAIATNAKKCAKIGKKMLRIGGSAVDAAIATLLCDGIQNPQGMGIGGGFLMTIWDASKKKAYFLNAREYAPAAATERIFTKDNKQEATRGGKAIAIPGEIAGYWAAHKKFGKLPWATLFEDAIKLCEQDLNITKYMANFLLRINKQELDSFPALKRILVSKNDSSRLVGFNEKIPARLKLAETLKKIRDHGADIFYKGEIAKDLIADIERAGGIITLDDLKNYEVQWKAPESSKIGKMTMFSAPTPGSGAVLAFILNILKKIVPTASNKNILWQRVIETLKWGFAKRNFIGDFIDRPEYVNKHSNDDCLFKSSKVKMYDNSYAFIEEGNKKWDKDCLVAVTVKQLLDESYADKVIALIKDDKTFSDYTYYNITREGKIDRGTAHTSVYAPDGSAVAVTSTINIGFGSFVVSESTGIILNDQMDDYSYSGAVNMYGVEPSEFNFVRNGSSKLRPMSSMAPTIIVSENQTVRLVIGSAGGPKIISGITQTIVLDLMVGTNIKTSLDYPRIHYNLWPMNFEAEKGFDPEVISYLKKVGHEFEKMDRTSGISSIDVHSRNVFASGDYRREGATCGF